MVMYGGPRSPSRDHIIPVHRIKRYWELKWIAPHLTGNKVLSLNSKENIEIVCRECNEDKGHLTRDEYVAVRAGLASRLDKGEGQRLHRINQSSFLKYAKIVLPKMLDEADGKEQSRETTTQDHQAGSVGHPDQDVRRRS